MPINKTMFSNHQQLYTFVSRREDPEVKDNNIIRSQPNGSLTPADGRENRERNKEMSQCCDDGSWRNAMMNEITKERAQQTDLAVVQHIHHGSNKVVVMGSCHALQRLQTTTTARQTDLILPFFFFFYESSCIFSFVYWYNTHRYRKRVLTVSINSLLSLADGLYWVQWLLYSIQHQIASRSCFLSSSPVSCCCDDADRFPDFFPTFPIPFLLLYNSRTTREPRT